MRFSWNLVVKKISELDIKCLREEQLSVWISTSGKINFSLKRNPYFYKLNWAWFEIKGIKN